MQLSRSKNRTEKHTEDLSQPVNRLRGWGKRKEAGRGERSGGAGSGFSPRTVPFRFTQPRSLFTG